MSQVAIVTGGAGSIGSAIAVKLAEESHTIVITDIQEVAAQRAAEQIRQVGGNAHVILADVRDREQTNRVAQETISRLGRIDVRVNAAGGHDNLGLTARPFHETSPEEWDVGIGVNVMGSLNFTHAVIRQMIEQRSGMIIFIASGLALRGGPLRAIYSLAKTGLIGFARSLAVELGPLGIRVNCVAPGRTITAWKKLDEEGIRRNAADIPLRSMTTTRDVAEAVAFLVSARASHITGACLDTSGGAMLH